MKEKTSKSRSVKSRRVRGITYSLVFIVVSAFVLPLGSYILYDSQTTTVNAQATAENANLRAEFWRAVRGGNAGYSSVTGSEVNTETNVLYNIEGENWRQIRNGWIANYGGWGLALVVLLILAFFVLRGRVELDEPLSGDTVPRWTLGERVLHWYTATLFIALSITGLSMLFGRAILIPLLGKPGFALWADFSINLHNFVGPFFVIGPILMFIFWVKHNIPTGTDVKWFFAGGGMIGKAHPSAGKANGGEKVWFWIVILLGLGVVSYTGFALIGWVEQYFGITQTREVSQTMHTWHAIAALLWIAVFFGHAYIGTIGSEGSLDAMTKGRVSVEWAKQHHDLWYEDVKNQADQPDEKMKSSTAGTTSAS